MKLGPVKLLILGFVFAAFGFSSNQAKSPAKTENFSYQDTQKNKQTRQNINKLYNCFTITWNSSDLPYIKKSENQLVCCDTFDENDDAFYFSFQAEFGDLGYQTIDDEWEQDVYIYHPASDTYLSISEGFNSTTPAPFSSKENAVKFHINGCTSEINFVHSNNNLYRLICNVTEQYCYYLKRNSGTPNTLFTFHGSSERNITKQLTEFNVVTSLDQLAHNDYVAIVGQYLGQYYAMSTIRGATNIRGTLLNCMFSGNNSFYEEQTNNLEIFSYYVEDDGRYTFWIDNDGSDGYLSGIAGSSGLTIAEDKTDYSIWSIEASDNYSPGFYQLSVSKGNYNYLRFAGTNNVFAMTKGSGQKVMLYRMGQLKNVICNEISSIKRAENSIECEVNDTLDLSTIIDTGENIDDFQISIGDPSLALINGAILTGVETGTTVLKLTKISNGQNIYFELIINDPAEPTLIGIELFTPPNNQNYWPGDDFGYEGLTIRLLYSDESVNTILSDGFNVSQPNMNQTGQQSITVTYAGYSTRFGIYINTPHPIELNVGETYDLKDLDQEFNNLDINDIEFNITNPALISRNNWVLKGILSGNTILTLTYLPTGAREQFALTIHDPSSEQGEDSSSQHGDIDYPNPDVNGDMHQDDGNGTQSENNGQGGSGESEGNNPSTGVQEPQLNKEDNMVVGIAAGGTAAAIVIGAVSAITTVSIKKKKKAKAGAQDKAEE